MHVPIILDNIGLDLLLRFSVFLSNLDAGIIGVCVFLAFLLVLVLVLVICEIRCDN